jgi:hypothetical protein
MQGEKNITSFKGSIRQAVKCSGIRIPRVSYNDFAGLMDPALYAARMGEVNWLQTCWVLGPLHSWGKPKSVLKRQ